MENRIEINGVWYVREDQPTNEPIELDPTHFEGYVVENKDFCFEATRLVGDAEVSIEATDKRGGKKDSWVTDYWDNPRWLKGILNNNPDSWKELPNMGKDNTLFLQAFLQFLTDKEWL